MSAPSQLLEDERTQPMPEEQPPLKRQCATAPTDSTAIATLPKWKEDEVTVRACNITEKLLSTWIVEEAETKGELTTMHIGKRKEKYKIVVEAKEGGAVGPDGIYKSEQFGGSTLALYIPDAADRRGLQILNAWVRKTFLKGRNYQKGLNPSPEQMLLGFSAPMDEQGTVKFKIDPKDPPLLKDYQQERITNRADIAGHEWNRLVFYPNTFWSKGLKSGMSAVLHFLRVDVHGDAREPPPRVTVDYDT